MNYKCLIVSNEILVINILTKYVNSIDNIKLNDICHNESQALKLLSGGQIDLLFVHLDPPHSHITDTAFMEYNPKVFVRTTRENFSIKANDLEAINHLMQPKAIQSFIKAITRLGYLEEKDSNRSDFITPEYIYFSFHRKMYKVTLNEIIYIESSKDYVTIHTTHDPPLRIKQSIGNLEYVLPRKLFLRIHRSFIVCIHRITAFTHYDIEIGDKELPIGRTYKEVYSQLKKG